MCPSGMNGNSSAPRSFFLGRADRRRSLPGRTRTDADFPRLLMIGLAWVTSWNIPLRSFTGVFCVLVTLLIVFRQAGGYPSIIRAACPSSCCRYFPGLFFVETIRKLAHGLAVGFFFMNLMAAAAAFSLLSSAKQDMKKTGRRHDSRFDRHLFDVLRADRLADRIPADYFGREKEFPTHHGDCLGRCVGGCVLLLFFHLAGGAALFKPIEGQLRDPGHSCLIFQVPGSPLSDEFAFPLGILGRASFYFCRHRKNIGDSPRPSGRVFFIASACTHLLALCSPGWAGPASGAARRSVLDTSPSGSCCGSPIWRSSGIIGPPSCPEPREAPCSVRCGPARPWVSWF